MSLRQELWLTKDPLNSVEEAIEWLLTKLSDEFQKATEIRIMINPIIRTDYNSFPFKQLVTYTASIKGVIELAPN